MQSSLCSSWHIHYKCSISVVIFIAEAEVPMLWPPGAKTQLIGKDPDAGKD